MSGTIRDMKRCDKHSEDHVMYGSRVRCKSCVKERNANWYSRNKGKVQIRATMNVYGLSMDEAVRVRSLSECEVCGSGPGKKGLHVDHDHETGEVRGVLCHGCNLAIGNVNDNPDRLRALADYLEAHN